MADPTVPQVVRSYLAELEKALAGVSADVREEIVAGIREELAGLDAGEAAARIEALGDPEFIAAEARAEAAGFPPVGPVETVGREPRWYPVLAALLVAFGAVVVPVIGWVVGIAMVVMSRTWRRTDKWVAVLTPFVAAAALPLGAALMRLFSSPMGGASGLEEPNPLIPHAFDIVWSSVFLIVPVNAVVGIWLLWRSKRSWSTEAQPLPPKQTAARPDRPQASWYPVVAVLLIIGGGYLIPFVGWVIGVAMLWAADAWSVRDKWLGTLAGPLAAVAVLGIGALANLAPGGLVGWHATILGVMVAPLIANLLVGIRLLRRTNGAGAPAASGG